MTWMTHVSGWVHEAMLRIWFGTNVPSRTTTAAAVQ